MKRQFVTLTLALTAMIWLSGCVASIGNRDARHGGGTIGRPSNGGGMGGRPINGGGGRGNAGGAIINGSGGGRGGYSMSATRGR